jgi:hypothetical protein
MPGLNLNNSGIRELYQLLPGRELQRILFPGRGLWISIINSSWPHCSRSIGPTPHNDFL